MDSTATLLHSQASSSIAPGVAGEQSPRSPDELVLQVELASRRYSITFKMLATGVIAGLRFRKRFACKLELDVRLESCSSGSGQPEEHSIINILPSCNHTSKLEMVSVFSPELVESIKHTSRCSDLLQQFGGLEGLAPQLHTDLAKGLPGCAEDLAQRKQAFGENVYPSCRRAARKMTWTALVKEVCSDKGNIIRALCGAGLSLGFGIKSNGLKEGWFEGASIIFEVILVVLITAMSNLKQSRHFLRIFQELNTKVVRCGQVVEVPILEVVVGDTVELRIGDSVPADGLLVQSDLSLAIDESDFSRQSCHYLPRKDAFIRSGTKVRDGSGTMLITAVGINTELEGIMALVPDNSAVDESHLQVRLSKAASLIGKLGLSVVIFILSILFILYFSGHWSIKGVPKFQAGKTTCDDIINHALFPIFSIAVNIVVVALPEGLPDLAITLTLAYSMHKMKATNASVRRLTDCQTMGSATTICSALTWNKMTVVKSWIAGNTQVEEERDAPIIISRMPSQLRKLLLQGIAQGKVSVPDSSNSGQMQDTGVGLDKEKMESKHVEAIGPTAEQALFTWTGKSVQEARAESSKLQLKRFNSAKKPDVVDMDVVETSEKTVYRGAAESILSSCHKWVDVKGHAIEITTEKREELETMIAEMAACSSKCVAFAYHDMTQEYCCMQVAGEGAEWQSSEVSNGQLTLLAVVGMKHPWKTAVNAMKAAGLTVRMVTGDDLMTANAIAKECGILEKIDEISLEADTLRSWPPSERKAKLPNVVVVAKALPSDKLSLVENLQSAGEVVAFIGNGANDAPALHKANIGLSMEGQGTEVAKENSDIMILHDDFTALITLVHGGRSLYFNIQKSLQFHLTVNMVAVVVNFVVAVTSAGDVSLTVKHLLWVNFILSIPGAFALATEAALNHELTLQHRPDLPCIINYRMWQNLSFQVIYQVGVLLTLQFHGASLLGLSGTPDEHLIKRTTIFNTFALCQLFNEVNTRQPYQLNIFRGVPNNSLYICIVASTLVLQIVMVELLERHMHWQQWLVCITLAFLSWPISFLGKVLVSISRRVITYLSLQLDRVGRNMRNINRSMCSSFHTLL